MSRQTDLMRELEAQHNINLGSKQIQEEDEEFEQTFDQDNTDYQNDIDNFDQKIKMHKEAQKIQNADPSDMIDRNNDSDSDEDMQKLKKKVLFGGSSDRPPQYKAPNIDKIQANIMTQQKAKVQQSEEYMLQEILNSGTDGMKDKKIKELVTRCRNLQVQFEREKALKIKMENQLNQMIKDNEEVIMYREQKAGMKKPPKSGTMRSNSGNHYSGAQSEISDSASAMGGGDTDWQKKYQQIDKKLQEFRVNNSKLKNDLNKANRIITREIGDNFDIDKAFLEENSWKGRAQQIEKLKAKVRDLNQKLGNTSVMTGFSDATSMGGGGTLKFDKTAADRRKEIESLKSQNMKVQEDYDLLLSKFKAIQTRKNNLESEIKDIKQEYEKNKKVLLSKSQADDKYIDVLKTEYEKLKKSKNAPRVIYKNECEHDHRDPSKIQSEQVELKRELKYLKEELDTKENMIQELIEEKLKADEMLMQQGGQKNQQVQQVQQQQQPQQQNQQAVEQYEIKIQKLQSEIKTLKKERNEFFTTKIADKDSRLIIKDLSMQNAQLRAKMDDLKQQQK